MPNDFASLKSSAGILKQMYDVGETTTSPTQAALKIKRRKMAQDVKDKLAAMTKKPEV